LPGGQRARLGRHAWIAYGRQGSRSAHAIYTTARTPQAHQRKLIAQGEEVLARRALGRVERAGLQHSVGGCMHRRLRCTHPIQ
jgi:hypothetical protein